MLLIMTFRGSLMNITLSKLHLAVFELLHNNIDLSNPLAVKILSVKL